MPNRGGYRKHAKKGGRGNTMRPLPLASDSPGLLYGNVIKRYGAAFGVLCSNGKEVRAIIRGKMHKRTWVNLNDFVLVDTSDINTFYIVEKFTPDEVRQLKSKGEITFDTSVIFDGDKNNDSDEDEIYEEIEKTKQLPLIRKKDDLGEILVKVEKIEAPGLVEKIVVDEPKVIKIVSESDSDSDMLDPELTAEIKEQRKQEQKKRDEALINKDKLLNKFKNKGRGGKNIVRERGRAAARDKKKRVGG
ncbi:MAG: hypothetical protein Harvfovirus24_3 [Harvfovirus sp.]|uniref:S1-like domain-containing protein n=1 Tax=Harvfovirus sp. TaxID=2487768 RepID=A0A3G5A216_9VIRU|nr:MAG: hypothetical protein Harvfovirus24_3 [Harvfovirus sp.]